jgi:hypothetical protein
MTTKVVIPKVAMEKIQAKLRLTLSRGTRGDSVNTKILALNRLIGGWCRYYQYSNKAPTQFAIPGHVQFKLMRHWLGSKYNVSMPEVMRRFRRGNTFATESRMLILPHEIGSQAYRQRFFKSNPYLTTERQLNQEELPTESLWTGYEARPGMADLRPLILERDDYTCQLCGIKVTQETGEVDRIRPVRRFKRPINANVEWNLWTLYRACHVAETKADRQGGAVYAERCMHGFDAGVGETGPRWAPRPAPSDLLPEIPISAQVLICDPCSS